MGEGEDGDAFLLHVFDNFFLLRTKYVHDIFISLRGGNLSWE